MSSRFCCAICGQQHYLTEISFGADSPFQWNLLSAKEQNDSELGPEQCVILSGEGKSFFVRACLEIPIRGTDLTFNWGVWVSLSEPNFFAMCRDWNNEDRTIAPPFFGWLCTRLPEYPDSMFLKTNVHQRPVGKRPTLELEPSDHILSIHQRTGIEVAAMEQIISRLHHGDSD